MIYIYSERGYFNESLFMLVIHFRYLMQKKKNTMQTVKRIYAFCGDGTIKGFAMFKNGNFDLEVKEHFGRPAVIDDQIEILIKNNKGLHKRHHIYNTSSYEICGVSLFLIGSIKGNNQ